MLLWSRKNRKLTHKDAQFLRPLKNTEKDLIEVIKYGAKIFVDPEVKKTGDREINDMFMLRH